MTFSIIGQNDATQFAVAGKVEAGISGEHQQTSHIPPTNMILRNEKETLKLKVIIIYQQRYILSINAKWEYENIIMWHMNF